jgi:hypothetical protein
MVTRGLSSETFAYEAVDAHGDDECDLLEPVKRAVAPWNFVEVSPIHMLGRFNGYL